MVRIRVCVSDLNIEFDTVRGKRVHIHANVFAFFFFLFVQLHAASAPAGFYVRKHMFRSLLSVWFHGRDHRLSPGL